MSPYWLLESPYSVDWVKMVLAAGKVTRTMPCTSPAMLTRARSAREAMGMLRWVRAPRRARCPPVEAVPSQHRSLSRGANAALAPRRPRQTGHAPSACPHGHICNIATLARHVTEFAKILTGRHGAQLATLITAVGAADLRSKAPAAVNKGHAGARNSR